MTGKNLFDFNDYKAYLRHRLNEKGARSGLRTEFAKALHCQGPFVSQVLNSEVHLSLEQAFRANSFFAHDSASEHYFMLLVQKDRASNSDLRDYFQKQIDQVISERTKLKNRVTTTQELSVNDQAKYYSEWDFAAVHMALAVPHLRRPEVLRQALGLTSQRLEEILQFLVNAGMAEERGQEYHVGGVHLHLGTNSPFLRNHHMNWRVEAMRRLNVGNSQHLHYSGVFSLGKKDFLQLRENLMRAIQENLAVVKPSPEEITVCQMIDLIPLA